MVRVREISTMPIGRSDKSQDVPQSGKMLLLGLLFFSLAPGCRAPPDEVLRVTTGIDAALLRLRSEYPDLELLCSDKRCIQETDLDGDREVDVVMPVRAKCENKPCPTGVVVLPTKAPGIRIGAGKRTRVREVDWELIDGKLVWESLGEAATLRSTQGLEIRATNKSLCARSMRLGRAILEFDGGDAVEALVFRRGHWQWVLCGY